MKMYRQGDILLIESEQLPGENPSSSKVLREGSMTGHNHIVKNGVIYFQRIDRNGVFAYLMAKEGCQLTHDEHKTISLPAGIYEVRRQREVSGYVED